METFLGEFGMIRAERTGEALYMRGTDDDAFLHVTHRGEPGFVAAAFEAASTEDLDRLAREEKAEVAYLDGPGGGSVVRLIDPNGFRIEVVAGRARAPRNRSACVGGFQRFSYDTAAQCAQAPGARAVSCEAVGSLRAERQRLSRVGSVV